MRPQGLYNIGNICYLNSLMQALFSCPSLNKKMARQCSPLAFEYNKIYDGNTSHVGGLLKIIKNNTHKLQYGRQEDAHEGLMMLLECLDSSITGLFGVQYNMTLRCKCGMKQKKTEPSELFVDYYGEQNEDLERHIMLNRYTPHEYKCDRCGTIGSTEIIKSLHDLNYIIIVTFKKYKTKSSIKFPPKLKLWHNNTRYKYRIVAQIEHMGSMHGGHYVARCLRGSEVYLFNDRSISESKFIPTANTYMVFYHLTY